MRKACICLVRLRHRRHRQRPHQKPEERRGLYRELSFPDTERDCKVRRGQISKRVEVGAPALNDKERDPKHRKSGKSYAAKNVGVARIERLHT